MQEIAKISLNKKLLFKMSIITLVVLCVFLPSISKVRAQGPVIYMNQGINNTEATRLTQLNNDGTTSVVLGPLPDAHKFDVSHDGTKMAYEKNGILYSSDFNGENEIRLTNSSNVPDNIDFIRWSPDDSKIAYVGANDLGVGVFTINSDGTQLQHVSSTVATDTVDWSPDGTRIVFNEEYLFFSDQYHQRLKIANSDGTNITDVYESEESDDSWAYPSWSPDGSQIAFVSHDTDFPYTARLNVINIDGTNRQQLYTAASETDLEFIGRIDWSPDGSKLAFATYDGTRTNRLKVISSFGGNAVTLYQNQGEEFISTVQWWGEKSTTISSPTNLSAVSPTKNKPALTWSAVSGASSYKVYRGGQYIGSSTTTSYTDQSISDGSYTYYVTASNGTNESQPSNQVSVVVDTVRPEVAFTAPSSLVGPFTTGPTVTVTASDPGSGLQNLVIHVYKSNNQLLTTCGSANATQLAAGSMSCNLATLPAGSYYIKAGSFDKAGNNKTVVSPTFTINP